MTAAACMLPAVLWQVRGLLDKPAPAAAGDDDGDNDGSDDDEEKE